MIIVCVVLSNRWNWSNFFANAAVIASVEDANLSDAEFNCVTTFFCEVYVVCNL
jgi:hypothetical protein